MKGEDIMGIHASNTRVRTVKLGLMLGGVAAACPAFAQTTPAVETGVQEIIVTAQKREQNIQNVPISITALGKDAIQANRIADVRDLNAVASNLTVRVSSGGSQIANYSMRGVVTSGSAPGSDKGISLYVDGVYVQSAIGSVFELADLERIEVVKGPQGTLFGRNATAGAISIITHEPTGTFGVRQELTYGNYDQFRSKTHVDLPQWGPVSASFSYVHSERRGDIRNLGAGTTWDYTAATGGKIGKLTSPKWLGNQNTESIGAAVKVELSPDLDLTYKFDYTNKHYTADGQGLVATNFAALGPLGPALTAMVATQPNKAILTPITTERPGAVNNAFTTPGFLRNWGHSVTTRYQLNDVISFKNIFAVRGTHVSNTAQLDGFGGLINTIPSLGPIGAPYVLVVAGSTTDEKQWSNEFQLNIDTDWFRMTAGYLHFYDHILTGPVGSGVAISTSFAARPSFVIPFNGGRPTHVDVKSDAFFVQPEFHLTDQLDLVLGSRITIDKKDGVDRTSPGLGNIAFTYSNSKPTYLAGLNYKVTPSILTYVKYSTGYISGGFLATRTYAPETSSSWEGGIKADLFDRRFRSNLAVFHVNYGQLQSTVSGLTVGVPLAAQVVINIGDARAKGFEWDNTLVPIDGLTLTGNVGYTDFHYRNLNSAILISGQYLPINRPKWTGNASAQYETGPVWNDVTFTLRGDVNYRSRTRLAAAVLNQQYADNSVTRGSWIVNGRAALSGFDLGRAKAELAVWGRNLTNNRQINNISTLTFMLPGAYEHARTFGVDLNIDF
jgi:iron complex outermembrane receptor protein